MPAAVSAVARAQALPSERATSTLSSASAAPRGSSLVSEMYRPAWESASASSNWSPRARDRRGLVAEVAGVLRSVCTSAATASVENASAWGGSPSAADQSRLRWTRSKPTSQRARLIAIPPATARASAAATGNIRRGGMGARDPRESFPKATLVAPETCEREHHSHEVGRLVFAGKCERGAEGYCSSTRPRHAASSRPTKCGAAASTKPR
jgi:hypothetical protein